MPNDSTTGGFVVPESSTPVDDNALNDILGTAIAGVTGMDRTLVRQRGQEVPAQQPDRPFTWCSFAVSKSTSEYSASKVFDPNGDGGLGSITEYRHKDMDVAISFYGPAACATAEMLSDGLEIIQNREQIRANGLAYVSADPVTFVPDFQNTKYIRRADLSLRFRRMTVRTYPIRTILSVDAQVSVDTGAGLVISNVSVGDNNG